MSDTNFDSVGPLTNGGIIAGIYTYPGGGGMNIDNMIAGSSNSPPIIQSIVVTNGAAVVTWSAIGACAYGLQWQTSQNTDWNEVIPEVVAAGRTAVATNILTSSSPRFFRVALQP